MLRSLPRIPDHLKKALEELLTPANIAIFVGITVGLMASGVGEMLGLGPLAVGFVASGRLGPAQCGGLLRLFGLWQTLQTGDPKMCAGRQLRNVASEIIQ